MKAKLFEIDSKLYEAIEDIYDSFTQTELIKINFLIKVLKACVAIFDIERNGDEVYAKIKTAKMEMLKTKIAELGYSMDESRRIKIK